MTFDIVRPLCGGALIGLGASLLLLTHGRIAGASGILAGVLTPRRRDIEARARASKQGDAEAHARASTSTDVEAPARAREQNDVAWRIAFLLALLATGATFVTVWPERFSMAAAPHGATLAAAGVLVGFGTRLGNGCTSGHGVCGLGRGSPRSLGATLTFMAMAMATVFVMRHVL